MLGHSFGGQIAVYVTAHHPELIDTLILSGPAVFRPKRSFHRFVFGLVAKIGKKIFSFPFLEKQSLMAKKVLYRLAHSPDYQATAGIKREIFRKIIREDARALLSKITTRTLVIWGSIDAYTPLKHGKKIVTMMPNAQLKIFTDGRHRLHIQMPDEFFHVIHEFLEKDNHTYFAP